MSSRSRGLVPEVQRQARSLGERMTEITEKERGSAPRGNTRAQCSFLHRRAATAAARHRNLEYLYSSDDPGSSVMHLRFAPSSSPMSQEEADLYVEPFDLKPDQLASLIMKKLNYLGAVDSEGLLRGRGLPCPVSRRLKFTHVIRVHQCRDRDPIWLAGHAHIYDLSPRIWTEHPSPTSKQEPTSLNMASTSRQKFGKPNDSPLIPVF